MGKRLMSATFVTDIATVDRPDRPFHHSVRSGSCPFVIVSIAMISGLPRLSHRGSSVATETG